MLPIQWLTATLEIRSSRSLFEQVVTFWSTVTGTSPLTSDNRDEGVLLQPASGAAYLGLHHTQQNDPLADDAESARAEFDGDCKLHFHLAAGSSLDDAVAEALALGAELADRELSVVRELGVVRLRSPGGYGFSVRVDDGDPGPVPAPQVFEGGGLNRADQICLDIPPQLHDREQAFWQALTGWALTDVEEPELSFLERAPGVAIRILLQRRDHAGPAEQVTAHLDFASADRSALASAHEQAGATDRNGFAFWITLRDPAGRIYCLTGRTPV